MMPLEYPSFTDAKLVFSVTSGPFAVPFGHCKRRCPSYLHMEHNFRIDSNSIWRSTSRPSAIREEWVANQGGYLAQSSHGPAVNGEPINFHPQG